MLSILTRTLVMLTGVYCATAATGEMEFVMSMNTSNIAPSFEIHPEQKLRIKARYDATVRHTGDLSYSACAGLYGLVQDLTVCTDTLLAATI